MARSSSKRSHTNNTRNNDTRATQMETASHCSDTNADPSTTAPAATHMDDAPSQSSIMVDTPVQLTVMKLISYFWILSMNLAWSN